MRGFYECDADEVEKMGGGGGGASGVFEGVLMRYARGEMIGFDARAVLGRVTMGHSQVALGSSRLIHRHLYSICILECAETSRFRGPLCLI